MRRKKSIHWKPLYKGLLKASFCLLLMISLLNCRKEENPDPVPQNVLFNYNSLKVDGEFNGFSYQGINTTPVIKISFTAPVMSTTAANAIFLKDKATSAVALNFSYENADSTLVIKPAAPLTFLSKYNLTVNTGLKSKSGNGLVSPLSVELATTIDSTDKYPIITTDSLLSLVQRQSFRYFWEFGHSISGMARERNSSGDVVTSGGTGFGIMSLPVAIQRKFITREEGLIRSQKIVAFLKNKAQKYHGVYPHWLNGATGATIPFSADDDGADLVETSYLMAGLLTVRQFFNGTGSEEATLRMDINQLWKSVEWSWYANGQKVLYWHWSPQYGWQMNFPVTGYNECLILYVMAASSPTFSIPAELYHKGWARSGKIQGNHENMGFTLKLNHNGALKSGGPLFWAHYSYVGLDPRGLKDQYADYWEENKQQTLINRQWCIQNPKKFEGYGENCWGLTASYSLNGYSAHQPDSINDLGVISPTAALSSFPYTPQYAQKALNHFYYDLGNNIWGKYGFYDAFSIQKAWYPNHYLAIDQGPAIVMIENYRTGLLWKLFMSCPEVQNGLSKLGFQSPWIKNVKR